MVKLLKGSAIVFIAIVVAYFFLIDGIIKSQLERQGALVLQAPLDIGKVTFHLIPASLTLYDVKISNAHLPTHNLVQAEQLSLPLSLRDLLAHKLLVDAIDIHGLRFNRPRGQQTMSTPTQTSIPTQAASATSSPQLREALQHIHQMLNHPLASNTIDTNTSLTGALLADQFKPLLTQITAALNMLTTASSDVGDWQILVRRVNIDGAFDFGANSTNNNSTNNGALRFTGGIDNVTPQPQLFDAVTQFDLRSVADEAATLHANGSLDKRKLAQAALRFDLNNFPIQHWSLSNDPELKIIIVTANVNVQALLSLTGNQFDFNALTRFQQAHFDIANGSDDIARVVADVWRHTDAFDINLQASGDIANPVLKLNSSLDVLLVNAIQQLQPAFTFPQSVPFLSSP